MTSNMIVLDSENNEYQILRIPTIEGGKLNCYFRKYVNTLNMQNFFNTKKTLYDIFSNNMNKSNEEFKDGQRVKSKLGNIILKEFENPMENKNNEKEKKKEREEILNNIPSNRTIFIINFEKPFEEKKLKKWFQTTGKIRHVFAGTYFRKIKNDSSTEGAKFIKKTVHFGLVVFKNEKDFKRCFEIRDYLQNKILNLYSDINTKIDQEAKEKYAINLISKYGQNELQDKTQLETQMEQDGFKIIYDHTGKITNDKVKTMHQKLEKDVEEMSKPTKKMKTLQHDDFYKFQIRDKKLRNELGAGDLNYDAFDKNNDLIVSKRKQVMAGFKADIEKLKQIKATKNQSAIE